MARLAHAAHSRIECFVRKLLAALIPPLLTPPKRITSLRFRQIRMLLAPSVNRSNFAWQSAHRKNPDLLHLTSQSVLSIGGVLALFRHAQLTGSISRRLTARACHQPFGNWIISFSIRFFSPKIMLETSWPRLSRCTSPTRPGGLRIVLTPLLLDWISLRSLSFPCADSHTTAETILPSPTG
jgi:hypothetical protein